MGEIPIHIIVSACGVVCGLIMGAAARGSRFCTFGAVEDYVLAGKTLRAKAWGLAIATAIIITQVLHLSGYIDLTDTIYLNPTFGWAGAILGGLMFGLGMAYCGTCGYGILTRMGGGDLKAFFCFLVLGLSAFMTARGLLGPVRVGLLERWDISLDHAGGQGIPQILGSLLGWHGSGPWMLVSGLLVVGLMWWIFRDAEFRSSRRDIFSGVAIGLAVSGGFAATGIIGNDIFDPQRIVSLTYALPPGETLVYLLTFTGASINFGIGVVFGTFIGAFAVAMVRNELRWEAYDDVREMRRHLLGAVLMGFGGVSALGCTVGQGITGMATLSASAPLALLSIIAGAVFGVNYLLTGRFSEAIAATLGRQ